MPIEHFKTHADMMRNLAWRHYHNKPVTAREICIGKGKNERCHKVKHSTNPKREAIDAAQRRKVARRKKHHGRQAWRKTRRTKRHHSR